MGDIASDNLRQYFAGCHTNQRAHPAKFGLQALSIVNLLEVDFAMPHINIFVLEQQR